MGHLCNEIVIQFLRKTKLRNLKEIDGTRNYNLENTESFLFYVDI